MYLLDTNVVSELRKAPSGKADANFVRWMSALEPSDCYLSVITILELETGVLGMERRDARQGRSLRQWLDQRVLIVFEHRILSVDARIARRAAALHVPDREADALIGATASVHGLSIVTRNTADFSAMNVALLDPWAAR